MRMKYYKRVPVALATQQAEHMCHISSSVACMPVLCFFPSWLINGTAFFPQFTSVSFPVLRRIHRVIISGVHRS